mgnify:CR=1 FL=1
MGTTESTEQPDSNNPNPDEAVAESTEEQAPPVHQEASQTDGHDPEDIDEIRRLKEEVEDYKDKFLRCMADMDNLRRRTEKEKSDYLKFGLESFFKELLPVLDSFDKALEPANDSSDNASFRSGVENIHRQLVKSLEKSGLEPVKAAGEAFDPNVHQAIQKIDSAEVKDETVAEEYARGYLLNGRLLRPAMVSVFVPSSES